MNKKFLSLILFFVFVTTFTVLISHTSLHAQSADLKKKGELKRAGTFESILPAESTSDWTRWTAFEQSPVDPYAQFTKGTFETVFKASPINDLKPAETDDEIVVVEKINALGREISGDINLLARKANIVPALETSEMVNSADVVVHTSKQIYGQLKTMYGEVGGIKSTLDNNYQAVPKEGVDENIALDFNAASDGMAVRAARMSRATDAMASKAKADLNVIEGMLAAVDHMEQDGAGALKMTDQVGVNIDQAGREHKALVDSFNKKFPNSFMPKAMEQSPSIFKDQKAYLQNFKNHVQKNEIAELNPVRKYLASAKDYTNKVITDLDKSQADFANWEEYFNRSKITSSERSNPDSFFPADSSGNVCEQSQKNKGLKELKECSKSCRGVCRWKEKIGDTGCYECPSGSPGSCWEVGGWPDNHPWCQPGGICHKDPMLYCAPYGTMSPNKEPLNCTKCLQRADLCAQKVGGGMTYTNCKLGCWNGACKFKGKYQEFEWDGALEWVHCYECKTPPPPPTCEDLKWGYDTQADCANKCPAPGTCVQGNNAIPGGAPPAPGGGQGENPGGQPAGGGSPAQGDTRTGEEENTDGKPPAPPTGSPEQPGGGGGSVAGGPKTPTDGPQVPGGETPPQGASTGEGSKERPKAPNGSAPEAPATPNVPKPQVTDAPPPEPPDNQQIQWYKTRLKEIEKIIDSRKEIVNDPSESDTVKGIAAEQIDSYQKEYDRTDKALKEEEARETERRRKEAEDKARMEEAQKRNEASRTKWPDPNVEIQKIRLKELKDAIDQLNTRAGELKEQIAGRKDHLDRLNHEIDLLQREIQHHKDAVAAGGTQERHAEERIKSLEAEIKHKMWIESELEKGLKEALKAAQEEIDQLKRKYQQKLYAADERAWRNEDTKRIDEYYELYLEGENIKALREARNTAFEEKFKETQSRIDEAKAKGDDDTVEKLETELANMKKGQQEWNEFYDRMAENHKTRTYETERRNFQDGAGPSSQENLGDKLKEYGKFLDKQIEATANRVAELELAFKEHRIGTSVRADGSEHVVQLDDLKAKLEQLRESRGAIDEKVKLMKEGYKLSDEVAASVAFSTDRYAEGTKTRDAEKSFTRLVAESIGEEALHNLRPDVALKKNVAFAWGVVQGVGSAVKGLADLGIGAVDLTLEMYLTDLGFDIETDKLDMLNNMITGASNNANFDGVIKATVALGGMIDKKITELEKSGDIDWATAEFGGKIAGDVVVADVVIGQALGKAATLLEGADKVTDAARVGTRTAEELAEAARMGNKTIDEVGDASRAASKLDDAPPAPKMDTPPSRGPPKPAGVYDNAKPLPTTSTRKPTPLADNVLEDIEKTQGFRRDHAQRMNEFAQEKEVYLIVRDGNPDSVPFFGDADKVPKPMSSKAKTAKVGPDTGLVVDPTHPTQAKYWGDALNDAAKAAELSGDYAKFDKLVDNYKKAMKSWRDYGDYMLSHGYKVDDQGRVLLKTVDANGKEVYKAVHGDYDLHGVYKKGANGQMEQVSFGSGNKFDEHGVDIEGGALRDQLNDKLTGGNKDFIQHGGQDDWVPDPAMVASKPADPPVTVFFPDGRPPKHLSDAKAMKEFYETEMGVQWAYPDKK